MYSFIIMWANVEIYKIPRPQVIENVWRRAIWKHNNEFDRDLLKQNLMVASGRRPSVQSADNTDRQIYMF